MSETIILNEKQAVERLQDLSSKALELNERIIRLKTQKEQNEKELASIENKSMEEFGTSDLTEMRNIYRNKVSEQSKAILEYEQEILRIVSIVDHIEAENQKIEEKYGN